jgi:hypothetical protein
MAQSMRRCAQPHPGGAAHGHLAIAIAKFTALSLQDGTAPGANEPKAISTSPLTAGSTTGPIDVGFVRGNSRTHDGRGQAWLPSMRALRSMSR